MTTRIPTVLISTAASLIALSQPAEAQDTQANTVVSEAPEQEFGDIVVTANKREQNIQQVGIAISALGQDSLALLGTQDIPAMAKLLPGVQIAQFSPTATVLNIRGVSQNDYADSQEAPIAFYSDGAYVSALGAISGMTYDLERVEVLRGPQGTLFGRNATGGLVQIISRKPTDNLEGYLTLTMGSYGQFTTEGAVGGPLTDSLRGRVSFTTSHGGAYMKNLAGPDLGAAKFYAGRVQVAGDLSDNDDFLLKVQVMRNDHERRAGLYSWAAAAPNAIGQGEYIGPNELGRFPDGLGGTFTTCPGCDIYGYRINSSDPFTTEVDGPSDFNRTYWSTTLNYNHDFGWGTLTSITDYQDMNKDYADDQDMTPQPRFHYYTTQRFWQASQELRLAGKTGDLQWLLGAYGIKIRSRSRYDADLINTFGALAVYQSDLKTDSAALFSQVEYALTSKLTLIGGLRYSWDRKVYDFTNDLNGVREFTFNENVYPEQARKTFKNWSGKVEIDFKPNAATLIYGSLNRGTKSGGFGTPAFGPFDPNTLPFDQEVLTSFEGGFKVTFLGGSAYLNGSGFHYKYRDYQSYESLGISLVLRNQQARITGAELELGLRPLSGLSLQLFAAYLDAKVLDIRIPGTAIVADRRMPNAPEWSVGGNARYETRLGKGTFAIQTNWKYNSSMYFNVFNEPVNYEPGYVTGDLRLSYVLDDLPVEVAAFSNNITNRHYRLFNGDLSSLTGSSQQTFAPPRWFGASVTLRLK